MNLKYSVSDVYQTTFHIVFRPSIIIKILTGLCINIKFGILMIDSVSYMGFQKITKGSP